MRKSQGEIFGIALMFVVIIIGILVYGQIKAMNNTSNQDSLQDGKYKILAEGTLNSILKMSSGCQVERNRDSVRDLINYCLENEYAGVDSPINCGDNILESCTYAKIILNKSLFVLFNSSDGLGEMPFELKIDIPQNKNTLLSNITKTNFGEFAYRGNIINESNRRQYGYKRAPSGLITWSTAQRNIEFELYLYYR